jgi:hypothetical protein
VWCPSPRCVYVCVCAPVAHGQAPRCSTVCFLLGKVHGGVRYLEKAVFNLDYGQLKLVFEALHERKRLLENAPHLTSALPIMTVGVAGHHHTDMRAAHVQSNRVAQLPPGGGDDPIRIGLGCCCI